MKTQLKPVAFIILKYWKYKEFYASHVEYFLTPSLSYMTEIAVVICHVT